MPSTSLRLPPAHLLACPACSATVARGLILEQQSCSACGARFFDLAGMPCWFPGGHKQKQFWNTLLAILIENAETNFAQTLQQSQLADLLPSVRERLATGLEANRQIIQAMIELFTQAGLQPHISPEFVEKNPTDMLQYYELLLRDWAWDAAYPPDQENENQGAFRRVKSAFVDSGLTESIGDTLVLGAGCGRLSWDIHRYLSPSSTLALDINPLLIQTAHRLVAQRNPWQLTEKPSNPQAGLPFQQLWNLEVPGITPELTENWFALAADAWHAPLNAKSFDVIVTPWFIDVCSREVRDVIGLVTKLLKPGGLWVNTGPLLYSKSIPTQQRYTHEEIVELAALGGFVFEHHSLESVEFLKSPLSTQLRTEQVWTFAARAPQADYVNDSTEFPPPWIQLPHLPIPRNIQVNHEDQPVLIHLLSLVDGKTSINQIAALMAANLGPDQDPVALVKTVFGQMLVTAAKPL